MPQKTGRDDQGVKTKGRSKKDKGRRNFELHGTYSQKHLRLREEELERQRARPKN